MGEKMILEDNMFIEEILGKIAVKTPLSREVLDVYNSYYPDAASRAPLLAWPREVPIGGVPAAMVDLVNRVAAFLTTDRKQKLLFHVTPGAITPPEAVDWLKANVPGLTAIHLGEGAHFIQEDYPDEIGSALADWIATL
jgi:haloalkane dehalogenase